MKKVLLTLLILAVTTPVFAYERIYANDGTYLGTNNPNQYDSESINNQYGQYGSKYSSDSINNQYGTYGSQYSSVSPNNPYAQNGRSIDINSRQSDKPVESFLQTDAAVNQGNSGGALVNTSGELVGINSAIASPTGSYAGYSYAIPVNIVKKVVTDIVKFGTVQRAYLGISYPREDMSEEQIKKMNEELNTKYKEGDGILITDVLEGSAAKAAGVKKGDILIKLNGVNVKSSPELQEQVAIYKPGDKVISGQYSGDDVEIDKITG